MAQCTVSGIIQDLSATGIESAVIKAEVITPVFVTTIQVLPTTISTTSSSTGAWSLSLMQGVSCRVTIEYPPNDMDSRRVLTYAITVPASGSANFSTLATEA